MEASIEYQQMASEFGFKPQMIYWFKWSRITVYSCCNEPALDHIFPSFVCLPLWKNQGEWTEWETGLSWVCFRQ